MTNPMPVVLFCVLAGTVVIGNLFPRKVSFLPGMRYYAGKLGHVTVVHQAVRGRRSPRA